MNATGIPTITVATAQIATFNNPIPNPQPATKGTGVLPNTPRRRSDLACNFAAFDGDVLDAVCIGIDAAINVEANQLATIGAFAAQLNVLIDGADVDIVVERFVASANDDQSFANGDGSRSIGK
jgi:hypothetical protein